MTIAILDIIKGGLETNLFGSTTIFILFLLFFLIIIMLIARIPTLYVALIISPAIIALSKVGYLNTYFEALTYIILGTIWAFIILKILR